MCDVDCVQIIHCFGKPNIIDQVNLTAQNFRAQMTFPARKEVRERFMPRFIILGRFYLKPDTAELRNTNLEVFFAQLLHPFELLTDVFVDCRAD